MEENEETETKTAEEERKMETEWWDILGISPDTKPEVKMIKRLAELHRNKLAEKLDNLEKNVMEGNIPKIDKKREYLEKLVKKYPNPEFLEVIDEIKRFSNYVELKDEVAQINRAEHYGILKCLEAMGEILGYKKAPGGASELGESKKGKIERKSSVTLTKK